MTLLYRSTSQRFVSSFNGVKSLTLLFSKEMISNCFISFKQVMSLISLRPTFKYTMSLASFKIRISLIRFVNKFKCFNCCAFFKKLISVNWQNFASKLSKCSTFENFSKFFKWFFETFNLLNHPSYSIKTCP